jgi:cation diffusion facilitator family transporter
MTKQTEPWEHDHAFGQDKKRPGELRTLIVVLLTTATMALEIIAGIIYGSMALLADGLHMASHSVALVISLFAYVYARRFARDRRFSFGTGKVNSLAGFTGAILLAVFALLMVWESVERLISPVPIAFNQALIVAVVGLLVNGLSVVILNHRSDHNEATHQAGHPQAGVHQHGHHDGHDHDPHHAHHHDHNLRAAYLHVLADALTSVLAIFALLAGKYFGLSWLDPVMGVVGATLVARWSAGLLRTTSRVLLDRQASEKLCQDIRERIGEVGGDVADLHVWMIAPGVYAVICSLVGDDPKSPAEYRAVLPAVLKSAHVTIEIWRRSQRQGDRG